MGQSPNCDNPPVYECVDSNDNDCKEKTVTTVTGDQSCPDGSTKTKAGANQFIISGGSAIRDIADLKIPAYNHGGQPLAFARRSLSRYFNVEPSSPAGSPGSLGSGGNWRHNWQWTIMQGTPHPVTGHETLVIDYPDGNLFDFTKADAGQTYMTSRSRVSERIEKDAINQNLYRLLFSNGSHLRIEKFIGANNQPYFLATQLVDAHGLTYSLNYDSRRRVTLVTDPGGNSLSLIYSSVGNFSTANVTFSYNGSLAPTAAKVSVAGDFNGWDTNAHTMVKGADGVWRITLPMQAGTWAYKIVVSHNNTDHWMLDSFSNFHDSANPATISINGVVNSRLDVKNSDQVENQNSANNEQVTFSYSGSATSVSVAGSFNGWNTTATPMTLQNGVWIATVSLAPGSHLYKFVINGSNWSTDPGNIFKIPNGFGGFNSPIAVGNVTEALTSVQSSTGTTVNYSYQVFSAGPAIYSALTSVNYGDGQPAIYSYEAPNFVLNRPRMKTADDSRYGAGKTGARIGYGYRPGLVEGFIQSEYNPVTNENHVTYDSITNPDIRTLTYPNGLVETVAVFEGHVKSSSDNVYNATVTMTRHDNGWGMAASKTDVGGNITNYERTSEFGVIKKTTYPDGTYSSKTFPDETRPFLPSQTRQRDGSTITYTRDTNGRPTRVDYSDGTYETFTYTSRGQIWTHRDVTGVETINSFANFQIVATRKGALGSAEGLTETTYDSLGRIASETGPAVSTPSGNERLCKVFTYDAAHRVTQTQYRRNSPAGTLLATESTTYDRFGNILSHTNAQGLVTARTYDNHFRQLTETLDPGGLALTTTYAYGNPSGGGGCTCTGLPHPSLITTPDGIVTQRSYDMLGNMTAETIAPGTPLATTTTYAYDVFGRVVNTTSPDGVLTTNTYNPTSGRLISVNKASAAGTSQSFSYTTTYTYDDNYGLTRTTHPDGSYESLTYNFPKRQLTQKSSHSSNGITAYRETYTYNNLGQLSTRTDGANRVTTYLYDAYGRNHKIRRADNREQTTTYDYASNPMTVTGYDGLVAQIRHDIFGRTVSTNHPDGSSTASYEPGPGGQVLDSTVAGVTTSHTYDVIGRVVATNTGTTQTTHAYNPALRQQISTSAGRSTVTTHDAAGRVSMVQTGTNIQVTTYSRSGGLYHVTTATDPAGLNLQSTTTYDGLGRKVADTDANGDTTTYTYDGRDLMLSYTNARGHTFSFQYDAAGRRTKRTEPDGTWQSHTYDFAGNLTSHRKADGMLLTHTYNVLNQPVSQTSSSGGSYVNWTYDALGRLTSMENQDVILGYAYLSGSSRIATESTTIKGLANLNRITTLAYDAQTRPAGFSRAGVFNVSYAHGSNGRISSVTNDTAPPLASYAYDTAGLPIGITHENGLFTSWTRDSAGRTTSVATATAGNAVRSSVIHTYDGASRRRSATYEDTLGQAYGYDAAGQVTAAKVGIVNPAIANPGVSPTHAYAYDKAGNRNSSLAFGQSTTYASSSVNAYTSISGGGFQAPSPTYDPNGNTLTLPRSDGSSQALTWDAHDRLRSASNTQSQISKVYDPLGRLVWIRSTKIGQTAKDEIWSWTGWTLLTREVMQGSTTLDTFRYIWGPDLSTTLEGAGGVGGLLAIEHAPGNSTTWDIRYVHYDANGNVIALTDASGSTSARYRYSPFGELIASEDLDNSGWNNRNIHHFSTKPEVTGTGLLYYGYRYYSPQTGRFINRDPIEESGGFNLYAMVLNDPINWIDLLGLDRLVFDGKQICRISDDLKECKKCWDAVSGKDLDGNGKFDDFSEDDQKQKGKGPIPEGEYELPSNKITDPSKEGNWDTDDWNKYEKIDGDGWKPWKTNVDPRGKGPWGDRFGRLKPKPGTNTHGRTDFNIHGGNEPGSAGCIDIGCNDKDFYDDIRKDFGGKSVPVTVDYSGNSTKDCDKCKDRKGNPWP